MPNPRARAAADREHRPSTAAERRERRACVAIEIRAAELAVDAPRGSPGNYGAFSDVEFEGWGIHYWNQYGGLRQIEAAPVGADQLAGWLAREIWSKNSW